LRLCLLGEDIQFWLITYVFHYSFTTEGERIIIEKKQQDIAAFLKHFLRYQKKGKSITLKELKKIEDESYDLP